VILEYKIELLLNTKQSKPYRSKRALKLLSQLLAEVVENLPQVPYAALQQASG
jgi:hypothetical protein